MRNQRRGVIGVDQMESRALLSGSGHALATPNPTVQADLAKIKTDQAQLQTDYTAIEPTLQADYQALQTAIKAAQTSTAVKAAQTTLSTDETTQEAILKADYQVVRTTTGAARQVALGTLKSAALAAAKALQADFTAVQTAINTDPGVSAAQAKFKADATTITAEEATLQGDYAQLFKDLKAPAKGTTTAPTGTPITLPATK